MVTGTGWRVEVRDSALAVIGVCDVYTSMKLTLRHRKAGAWSLDLPASHPQASLFAEGGGIIVWAPWSDSEPLMSGKITVLSPVTTTRGAPAMLTVTGVDDLGLLADRLVLPDPSSAMDDQDAEAYFTVTGKAEAVIRTVVEKNAGTEALIDRRMCDGDPNGVLATPASMVGTTLTLNSRFGNLLSVIDEVGLRDNLGVRLVQPAGVAALHLSVYLPADVSDQVRLSQYAGTLTSATAVYGAPAATNVLVAGGGEGVDRLFVERSVALTAWSRRIEVFRDARDTIDVGELEERGDETLLQAAGSAAVSLVPVDTPNQRFGYDYGLGDTITVEVGDLSYTDTVTAVEIVLEAETGAVVTPSVGDVDESNLATPAIYQRVRELMRRLDALERRQ